MYVTHHVCEANFDSIDFVDFEESDDKRAKPMITAANANVGPDKEIIIFTLPVPTEGNIEEWMKHLELEMMRSLKDVVRRAAVDCQAQALPIFLAGYCAQVSLNAAEGAESRSISQCLWWFYITFGCVQVCLLGLQMQWTQDIQEAIAKVPEHQGSARPEHAKPTQCGIVMKAMSPPRARDVAVCSVSN